MWIAKFTRCRSNQLASARDTLGFVRRRGCQGVVGNPRKHARIIQSNAGVDGRSTDCDDRCCLVALGHGAPSGRTPTRPPNVRKSPSTSLAYRCHCCCSTRDCTDGSHTNRNRRDLVWGSGSTCELQLSVSKNESFFFTCERTESNSQEKKKVTHRHGGRLVRQELGQGRRVPTCLAPRLTFTQLHQRFRDGNDTRCPSIRVHLCSQASAVECWHLPCFSKRASSLQHPPVSMVTTSRHRLEVRSSGHVASLSRRACANTAPSSSAAPGWPSPEAQRALRKVMSTASWAPLKHCMQILRQNLDAPLNFTRAPESHRLALSSLPMTPAWVGCLRHSNPPQPVPKTMVCAPPRPGSWATMAGNVARTSSTLGPVPVEFWMSVAFIDPPQGALNTGLRFLQRIWQMRESGVGLAHSNHCRLQFPGDRHNFFGWPLADDVFDHLFDCETNTRSSRYELINAVLEPLSLLVRLRKALSTCSDGC